MAVTKLTHQVNIVNGTTSTQKQAEFAINFINWLQANWPGSDVLTKTTFTDVIGESAFLLNAPWNGSSSTAVAGGTVNAIKLAASASAVDDFYTGQQITINAGPLIGQVRTITAYAGSTKMATVDSPYSVAPTTTSTYTIREVNVPQWFKSAWVDTTYRYIFAAITFTHAASNTDWCIVGCKDGSTAYGNIAIGIRQNDGGQVVYTELTRYSDTTTDANYLNNAESIVLTIMDKTGEYKLIAKDYNASAVLGGIFYNGIVRLDNPVEPTDANAWFLSGQNNATYQRFTTAFAGEALGTQVSVVSDTLVPEGASFDKNVYTGKIPLARVWAGTANHGMRGWTSWLAVAPQSYVVSNQLYTIGADTYYGLGIFDNQIQLPGGGANIGQRVLLKV